MMNRRNKDETTEKKFITAEERFEMLIKKVCKRLDTKTFTDSIKSQFDKTHAELY